MSQLVFGEMINEPDDEPKKESESWYKGRTLSHSSIHLYRQCPQKWKFKYVDKIPEKPRSYFSFGKSVHAGLEFLFTKIGEALPSLEDMLERYKAGWLRDGYDSAAQEKWFFQEGERILKGFYAKHKGDFQNVLKVEFRFTLGIDGVPVTGFIDRIDGTKNGGVAIVDYKTGKAFDKARVRQDPQLTLYQIASRELLGKDVETVSLYHLNSLTPLTVPAHSSAMEAAVRATVVETAQAIQSEKFDPKPEAKGHCQWCDYVQICPAFSGKRISLPPTEGFQEPIGHVADRYAQLDKKVRDLTAERDLLGDTLRSHFRHTSTESVDGKHHKVKVVHGENGEEPHLETEPLT